MRARTAINGHLCPQRLPARHSAAAAAVWQRRTKTRMAEARKELARKERHWDSIKAEAKRVDDLLTRATKAETALHRFALFPERFDPHEVARAHQLCGSLRLSINFDPNGLRMPRRDDADAYIELVATRFAREVYEHARKTLKLIPA